VKEALPDMEARLLLLERESCNLWKESAALERK